MEHKIRETVSTVEEKCDFIQCDKCGAILHVNVHAHGRLKAIDAGEDSIAHRIVYYETRCYDPDLEESEYHHYCNACMPVAISDWMHIEMPDRYDPEIEVTKRLGVLTKNFNIPTHELYKTMVGGRKNVPPNDSILHHVEDSKAIIESIENGTHPIIQAEEEMLNGPFVDHPPEGREWWRQ